jgi:4-amino-4-deoxy-L-arabinose transferase-like glycosyltransferase
MIACVVIAIAIMTVSTRWGLALSSDSARYVRTARHVLGTEPIVDIGLESKREAAHYPPFYPMTLAAAGFVLRQDPLHAARWLHVAIFAGSTLLIGTLVWRFGGRAWAAVLAATLFALSPVSITTHAWLLSEALFILLALLTIFLLALLLDRPTEHAAAPHRDPGVAPPQNRWPLLIAMGLVTSLAMMTRYAGAALGPACALALLLLKTGQPWRRRMVDAGVFSAVALALPLAQFGRNLLTGGSAANRTIAFHPISLDHLKDGVAAVATWIAPLGVSGARDAANAHPIMSSAGVIIFAAVMIAGALLGWRHRREAIGRLAACLLLFIVCFVALLVFSISLVDFHTPMDTRVLSPVFAAWAVLAAVVLSRRVERMTPGPRAVAAVIALTGAVAIIAWPSIELVRRLHREGDGFAHPQWRNSATMAAVRALPPDQQIFTNAPGAVYLLSGRQLIWTIPAETSASSRLPNPEYPALMARISVEVQAGRGVVVWLDRYGRRRAYYPTAEHVRRRLGLRVRQRFNDGAIFDRPPIEIRDGVTE